MTACVNKKKSGVVSKVVTASLVGALTLGGVSLAAVPTVAVAETGATEQAATNQDAFDAAKITKAITTNNKAVNIASDGSISVTASAEGIRGVYPTELQVAGTTISISEQDYEDVKYVVNFFDADGLATVPVKVGDYTGRLQVNDPSSPYNNCFKTFKFRIVPAELGNVTVVNSTDGDFVYDGETQIDNAQVLIDGKKFDSQDFDWSWHKKGDAADKWSTSEIVDAGDYVVKLVGRDGIYKGSTATAEFTVKQLDLSKADVVIKDVEIGTFAGSETTPEPSVYKVNGKSTVVSELKTEFKSGPTALVDEPGEYTYTVSAKDASNPNVTGSKDVTFNAVEDLLDGSHFYYSKGELKDDYYLDNRRESFNTDLLNVTDADGNALDKSLYTVTVKDADGNVVSNGNITKAGDYSVTVSVNAKATGYKLGGKKTAHVNIIGGVVQSANVYFTYGGQVAGSSKTVTYDGSDLSKNLGVVVYDDLGNELKQGTDYTVKMTDANDNEVSSITDAGTYKVTVHSDTYAMSDETFTLTVDPITVTEVRVSNLTSFGEKAFYPYTGSDITPALQYKDADGNWKDLPADTYELVLQYSADQKGEYKVVDSINKVGFYKVYVHQAEGVKNYRILDRNGKGFVEVNNGVIEVSDQRVFSDVPNNAWYSVSVYNAAKNGFINGYSGSTLFGPNDPITRGQVATILFNMAGGTKVTGFEGSYSEDHGYETGFSDVDGKMYYAQAIAWAKKAGVVNGADGKFRPDDAVTREEFVSMLANYATLRGDDMTTSDSDLAKFADADQVSGYAKANVAWAAKNGYVNGQDGSFYPARTITRAEVAAVADNYQPKGVDDSLLGK